MLSGFYQESEPTDDLFNCETEGILGTVASIVGTIQANEILKKILNIGQSLNGYILILNLLDLNFALPRIPLISSEFSSPLKKAAFIPAPMFTPLTALILIKAPAKSESNFE